MMQNIENARLQLLESINIGQVLENYQPMSMQGSGLKKQLVESFNSGKFQTVTSIVGASLDLHGLCHVDKNAFAISESINDQLGESIVNHIVYCFEALEKQRPNALTSNAMNKLNDLVTLNESEIITKIRSGFLNAFKSNPFIDSIIQRTRIVSENEDQSATHKVYVPVSYVETINEHTYLRLGNKVLMLNENEVFVTKSPNPMFKFLSSIVESMSFNADQQSFEIAHQNLGKFYITESMIQRQAPNSEQLDEYSSNSLVESMSMIVENAEFNGGPKNVHEQRQFIDAILALHENFDRLAVLDNCVIVEQHSTKDKFALLVHEGKAHLGVLQSSRFPNVFESFDSLTEGIDKLKRRSGYDASSFFVEQLAAAENIAESKVEVVKQYQEILEGLKTKRSEIQTMINEEKAKNKPNQEKLQILNENKNQVQSLIVEQQGNLDQFLKESK